MHEIYRMIVCDLDNTLVDSKKQLSAATIQEMIRLQEKGYLLVIASGRFIHEIEPVAKALQIEEHHGIIIACNGFEIYDKKDNSYHRFTPISAKESEELIRFAKSKHCCTYLYDEDGYYFIQTGSIRRIMRIAKHLFPLFRKLHPKIGHGIDRYEQMQILKEEPHFEHSFQKLCFLSHKPKHIVALETAIHRRYGRTYQFFYENPFVSEITKSEVSKRHAVEYICQKYGYEMKQVIAFGDNGNDLLLLEAAGHGVTMKNASRYIRAQANHITEDTCDEDGVIHYLKKMNL